MWKIEVQFEKVVGMCKLELNASIPFQPSTVQYSDQ